MIQTPGNAIVEENAMASPEARPGRTVTVTVRDQHGLPQAGDAVVAIRVDGRPRGLVHLGEGAASGTISLASADALVELELRSGAIPQRIVLPPGQDSHEFRIVGGEALVRKAKIPPVARCPDGTTNSPCVTCRDGDETWTICVS
jgi:hypothetical protein